MSETPIGRRSALGLAGAFLAGCSVARTQAGIDQAASGRIVGRIWEPTYRQPPGYELVNSFEFEDQARHLLPPNLFERIAGGNRVPFETMTFRPRMGISTADMDLSVPLFGESLFTPIVVGPISDQRLYHDDGELATVQGAAAARTVTIVSSRSSVPLDSIARASSGPLWVGIYADGEGRSAAEAAVGAGAAALFVTVGSGYRPPEQPRPAAARLESVDWRRLDSIRGGLTIPIAIKGILTPTDAASAVERGYQAIVVSDHGRDGAGGITPPISALPGIVDATAGRIPVLVDGSFRRGTDVLKALILGADGVLLGRPVAWGLSAYGADGVQWVLEKVQAELARAIAMVGVSRPADLTRSHIRIHRAATA